MEGVKETVLVVREREWMERNRGWLRERVEQGMVAAGVRYWQRQEERYWIWLQWSRQHRLGVARVVELVVKRYRHLLQKSGSTCGVSMSTLTGKKAKQWLDQEMKQGGEETGHQGYRRRFGTLKEYRAWVERTRKKERRIRQLGKRHRGAVDWMPPWSGIESGDPVLEAFGITEEMERRENGRATTDGTKG